MYDLSKIVHTVDNVLTVCNYTYVVLKNSQWSSCSL